MRKDIEIHINIGDVVLKETPPKSIYPCTWIETPEGKESGYIYGEVVVSNRVTELDVKNKGVNISIPYTPVNKPMRIRIMTDYGGGVYRPMVNLTRSYDEWNDVSALINNNQIALKASQLLALSNEIYSLSFADHKCTIYSGFSTDFNIVPANSQNKNLLLKCIPGNNYRYPMVGVGLVRYTNGNIEISTLADVLQQQFRQDGTPVIDASYDYETKHLLLILDTSNVDL